MSVASRSLLVQDGFAGAGCPAGHQARGATPPGASVVADEVGQLPALWSGHRPGREGDRGGPGDPGYFGYRSGVSAGSDEADMCMVRTPSWETNTSAGEVRM